MSSEGGAAVLGRERKRLCVELDPLPTDRFVNVGLFEGCTSSVVLSCVVLTFFLSSALAVP